MWKKRLRVKEGKLFSQSGRETFGDRAPKLWRSSELSAILVNHVGDGWRLDAVPLLVFKIFRLDG